MIKLLPVIKTYVDASNAHDVQSILSCFSGNAVVRDEGETLHGRKAIEDWITRTIEKYKFQFKPVTFREDNAEVVVAIEVSGTFDESPITLYYHFMIEGDKILSLTID
jgi:ketosteroid isomerase-like protein